MHFTVLSMLLLFLKEFSLYTYQTLPHLYLLVYSRKETSGNRVLSTEKHTVRSWQQVALWAVDSPVSEIWGEESEG